VVNKWKNALQTPGIIAATAAMGSFLLGWSTFILYGLIIAPDAFIIDHLERHVVERLNLQTIDFTTIWHGAKYPSILGLWKQFADHTGWVIVATMLSAIVWAMPRVRRAEGVFLIWVVIGAVGFSLVDWRITKHLAHLLPPLAVLTGLWWASLRGRTRALVATLLILSIAWNIWRVTQLMENFAYLTPAPLW
jgi:hypothetical protein